MDELWRVVAELGLELHPDRIDAVAAKIESLDSVERFVLARTSFGPNTDREMVDRLDFAWRCAKDVQPRELAAALRGASATASLQEPKGSVEMVWTGPSTGMVPVRHTEQVLCEVIDSARNRIFIVSFVAYEVDTIMKALREAIGRKVRIDVLLEASTDHGGKVTVDSVGTMKEMIPDATVYVWNADDGKMPDGRPIGSVHAKCAVSDGKIAFLTSANLSKAAMERNMELGVFVRGGHLPEELHRHLEALVKTEIVKRV
jgi:cardiolipin synthase